MMDWNKLLSTRRFGQDHNDPVMASRSPFHKDQDRIVFSSAFRRLQDKTQVHTLTESDYVRTRLTHSMEAASVGRSLGANAGQVIIDRHLKDSDYSPADIGHILSAACMAHDIGNPPFGHFGEEIIRDWFKNGKDAETRSSGLTDEQLQDFEMFEGNAQGFRILTKLQNWRHTGGLRLTFATLGTFMKYPRTSVVDKIVEGDSGGKKFGIMQSERDIFRDVAAELGLLKNGPEDYWCRHPLAYLVEAADDICYSVVDIEDGFKLGRLGFKETEDLMLRLVGGPPKRYHEIDENSERISYLRAKCIGRLIGEVSDIFKDCESEILAGKFTGDLLHRSRRADMFVEIEDLCKREIYRHRERIQAELSGAEILSTLLEAFYTANLEWENHQNNGGEMSPRSSVLMYLFPTSIKSNRARYDWLLEVTDFVSGMTDSYALRQFRELKGFV
ncbi:MAG: deoxyguanosinetriphosphate triphosphohydrolase [Sneathiella sp.]|nr:MAG: deoxyguanosinetriphosphate triphosphohydrolase [Sneathiella sp.]